MYRYYYNDTGEIVLATQGKMFGGVLDMPETFIESEEKVDIDQYRVVNGILEPK